MSLLHTSAPYRRAQTSQPRVPVVLPLVQVGIDEDGALEITVDHEPYHSERPLRRDGLRYLLDQITGDLASPVKVEIHEPDGSVFTDFITPEPQRDTQPHQALRTRVASRPGEVSGDGFLPHEEVAVAVIVAHQVASSKGTARLRLPPALLDGRPGAVVLLGQTSGAIATSSSSVTDGAE